MSVRVSKERMAVGPRDTSLLVPKKLYTKHPINEEYRPYWRIKRPYHVQLCSTHRMYTHATHTHTHTHTHTYTHTHTDTCTVILEWNFST